MSYKTIVVHIDLSRHLLQRVHRAAALADVEEAHLIGVAMSGPSRFAQLHGAEPVLRAGQAPFSGDARAALDLFIDAVRVRGLSYETRLIDDTQESGLLQQAGYADLIVVNQPDPAEVLPHLGTDLPGHVMLNGARPVLILPYAPPDACVTLGLRPLVAWDGSVQATRAVNQAIPILKRAQLVRMVLLDPLAREGRHAPASAVNMATNLARHGITVEVLPRHAGDLGPAATLLTLATDVVADLLVMGGYGHPPAREALLGGVTRDILRDMTLPVLMSH